MRTLVASLVIAALVVGNAVLSVPLATAGGNNAMALELKWRAVQAQQEKTRQHLNAIEAEAAKMDEFDQGPRTVKPKIGK